MMEQKRRSGAREGERRVEEEAFGRQSVGQGGESHSFEPAGGIILAKNRAFSPRRASFETSAREFERNAKFSSPL